MDSQRIDFHFHKFLDILNIELNFGYEFRPNQQDDSANLSWEKQLLRYTKLLAEKI